jgi:hypothetical protein
MPGPLVLPFYLQDPRTSDFNAGGANQIRFLAGSGDNLTAHAGGGQALATAIPGNVQIARVTVVGSAADSVILPASVSGLEITVVNAAAANAMNVFPAVGEIVNALAANAAFSVAAGKTCTFYCATSGQWHTQLSA